MLGSVRIKESAGDGCSSCDWRCWDGGGTPWSGTSPPILESAEAGGRAPATRRTGLPALQNPSHHHLTISPSSHHLTIISPSSHHLTIITPSSHHLTISPSSHRVTCPPKPISPSPSHLLIVIVLLLKMTSSHLPILSFYDSSVLSHHINLTNSFSLPTFT